MKLFFFFIDMFLLLKKSSTTCGSGGEDEELWELAPSVLVPRLHARLVARIGFQRKEHVASIVPIGNKNILYCICMKKIPLPMRGLSPVILRRV